MSLRLPGTAVLLLTCVGLIASASAAAGQDEAALRSYFEGRRVTLRMDMPGSSDGVDLRVDAAPAIDFKRYGNDVKRYGVAIGSGESTVVTLVRVKKDLIEFQLGGGGFGTFGDDTSTTANIPLVEKSNREKELERRVKEETDREARRRLQRELDDLRSRRERENRRINAERARIEEQKRARIADQRLRGGSRFNLRYADRVPARIRPEDIVAVLTEYVDFKQGNASAGGSPESSGDVSRLRKGMLRADVERMFGRPTERSEKREGAVVTTSLVFDAGDQIVKADFVEDVLIRYTVSSR